MRICPACGENFRKGARALLAARTGARMATVCSACAARGLLIVQDRTVDETKCVNCNLPATHCALHAAQRRAS
jgi:hypothetical protein